MKLLEYQAKRVLADYGLPVPKSESVFNKEEVAGALEQLGLTKGIAKAQAYTGGRGKAGGIKLFNSPAEAETLTESLLQMTLVTKQTGPQGTPVHGVLLEEAGDIAREIYVAVTIDRARANPVLMISPEGGMDIEEVAASTPEKILKLYPPVGEAVPEAMVRESAGFLDLSGPAREQWPSVLQGLYRAFREKDCSLLEINPLIVNGKGELALLDCKFDVDDNALFRQGDLGGDPNAELSASEIEAKEYGLSYIKLDGNIGCMVNGAGLAMATMDIIQIYGKQPANFLDVGGSASEEAVTKAFQIITSDPNVKAILVNIFGGIMECDKIARGIINAAQSMELSMPLVVRLSGTRSEEGRQLIDESGLTLISAETLEDAAQKVVAALKEGK